MAYIYKEPDFEESELDPGDTPSFINVKDNDPYLRQQLAPNPDVRRNLLTDLMTTTATEATMLPAPPEKDCLKVFLRVKPKTRHEKAVALDQNGAKDVKDEDIIKVETDHQIAIVAPKESKAFKNSESGVGKVIHRFTFNKIYKPETGQSEIYETTVLPRLKDFLEGQNQLLFTYGATSSGKTYTIQGSNSDPGIMPRALATIFSSIENKVTDSVLIKPTGFKGVTRISQKELDSLIQDKQELFKLGAQLVKQKRQHAMKSSQSSISSNSTASSSVISASDVLDASKMDHVMELLKNATNEANRLHVPDQGIAYAVYVSFVEIYNENVYDLFENLVDGNRKLRRKAASSKTSGNTLRRKVLRLYDDRDGATYCRDLIEIPVSSAIEAFQALVIGRENLQFAATKLNQNSSRSHCIFTIKLIRVSDVVDPQQARTSILSFCDLAGSERLNKTQNVGTRQKEAANINISLMVLGRCIKAIRSNQALEDSKKHELVPFREAKLTRLLKTFLTGLGKATLVVCISQAQYLFEESVHVLKFASIANKITIEQKPEPPPPKRRKTRFSSMIVGQKGLLSNSIMSGTIAWEPSSRSTMIPPEFRRPSAVPVEFRRPSAVPPAAGIPLPNFAAGGVGRKSTMSVASKRADLSELIEDDDEADDTTMVLKEQCLLLLDMVDDLKKKLEEEKKKATTIETETRKELCGEFNKMMVEMNNDWRKRLEEERESVEKYHNWKINAVQELYKEYMEKHAENGDSVSAEKFEELKQTCQDKDQQLEGSKAELEANEKVLSVVREALKIREEENSKIHQQKTELKSMLEEQKKISSNLGQELQSVRKHLEEEKKLTRDRTVGDESDINALKSQISDLLREQQKRDDEIADKNELLQEAGDEFLAKEEELAQMQAINKNLENQMAEKELEVDDLQNQLHESHLIIREACLQAEEKEMRIIELEDMCDSMKAELENLKTKTRVSTTTIEEKSSHDLEERREDASNMDEDIMDADDKDVAADDDDDVFKVPKVGIRKWTTTSNLDCPSCKSSPRIDLEEVNQLLKSAKHCFALGITQAEIEKEDGLLQDDVTTETKRILSLLGQALADLIQTLQDHKGADSAQVMDQDTNNQEDGSACQVSTVKVEQEFAHNVDKMVALARMFAGERKRLNEFRGRILDNRCKSESLKSDSELEESKVCRSGSQSEDEASERPSEAKERLAKVEEMREQVMSKVWTAEEMTFTDLETDVNAYTEELEKLQELLRSVRPSDAQRPASEVKSASPTEDAKEEDMSALKDAMTKESAKKDAYIRELEDVIMDKEYRISELGRVQDEAKAKPFDQVDTGVDQFKELQKEMEDCKLKLEKSQATIAEKEMALDQKKKEVDESLSELKILQRATKNAAIMEQELSEAKKMYKELEAEMDKLKVLEEARQREANAINVLSEELVYKKDEVRSLQEKVNYLNNQVEAKEYEVQKTKEEREELMAHYSGLFKRQQQELNSEKMRTADNLKLQEVIAKATPSKNSEVKELTGKLNRVEEENSELKSEIAKIQKLADEKRAAHEREIRRLKKAHEASIEEFKEANAQLQQLQKNHQAKSGSSLLSPTQNSKSSLTATEASSIIDADDDKTDASLVESTPAAERSVRGRGRPGGRGRRGVATSTSLASFEDSNTENEPETTSGKGGRKPRGRTTRNTSRSQHDLSSFSDSVTHDDSVCKKRVLRETQLTPVKEGASTSKRRRKLDKTKVDEEVENEEMNGTSDLDATTPMPASRRRKLFSVTPQVDEVFSTPSKKLTDSCEPSSTVKRQLRARSSRKK